MRFFKEVAYLCQKNITFGRAWPPGGSSSYKHKSKKALCSQLFMHILPDLAQEYFLVNTYHKFQTYGSNMIINSYSKGIIFIKKFLEQNVKFSQNCARTDSAN